jgi:heme-degrading monooxygenase HmoA
VVTIQATVEVQPGQEADFEALWRHVRSMQGQLPGVRTQRLLRDTTQPGRYVVYDEWEDREQYDAFVRRSGMLWLLDATDHWIAPPRWSFFENVEDVQEVADVAAACAS